MQLGDEGIRAAPQITSLTSEFPAGGIQQHKAGKTVHAESLRQLLIGLFKRGILLFVAGKIQLYQHELAFGVAGEFVRGQHIVVEFNAPATPVRAGKIEQHHLVFRPCLIQGRRQVGAP